MDSPSAPAFTERRGARLRRSPVAQWLCRPFGGLGVDLLYALLQLRQQVFSVEQACAYLDADGLDLQCWHLLGVDGHGRLLACLRILPPGLRYDESSIGRVATHLEARGTGLGLELMAKGVARCLQLHPGHAIRISAQAHLDGFYARLGFVAEGSIYLEDDIPHVSMLRPSARPVRHDDAGALSALGLPA